MKSYYIFHENEISWAVFTSAQEASDETVTTDLAIMFSEVRRIFIDLFQEAEINSHEILTVLPAFTDQMTIREHNLIVISSNNEYPPQAIYQFSHELCHFMVPEKVCKTYRWFEEMLCEAMSWYAILKVLERGNVAPIKQLRGYYNQMERYVAKCQSNRLSIGEKPISLYISDHIAHLKEDCYDRRMNAAIAYELFPILQEFPDLWKIVLYLHTLTDEMPLSDALDHILLSADVVETGRNQLKQILVE